MQKQLIRIENPNNTFYIYWILTDFCNQHCSYCPKNLNSGNFALGNSPGFPTIDQIDQFIDSAIEIAKTKDKKIELTISGGEPTTHPYLPNIISKFKPHGTVEIITNGTRGLSWWKELPSLPDRVVLSLHTEYYDSKKLRISDLANFLVDSGVDIRFNLMCDPSRWDIVKTIVGDIDSKFRSLILPKVLQDQDNRQDRPMLEYTDEQLSYIKQFRHNVHWKDCLSTRLEFDDGSKHNINIPILQANGLDKFFGWRCVAGSDAISVLPNGRVQAGICSVHTLGTLSSFKLLNKPTICLKPTCTCPADIILNKYKGKLL
jgi:molybdenum cofactor biosynthesis enzyme MoaA